jgi:hypothetical protein
MAQQKRISPDVRRGRSRIRSTLIWLVDQYSFDPLSGVDTRIGERRREYRHVGVPDSTAVCRIHGSEEKYSENQTSTHQRPRTAHRQRRQRRNGQSSLRKWIAVSNRLPLRRPEPITRTKPTSTRYWRRVSTTECYGTFKVRLTPLTIRRFCLKTSR